MSRANPIQFAVVREDPEIEAAIVRRTGARRVLLVGSGGCTALSLRALFPGLELTLVDPNPAQLDLVDRKAAALAAGAARRRFNVDDDAPDGLNACGNFESLFRLLRDFVRELILPADELAALITDPARVGEAPAALFSHRYWRPAFDLFFSESLLVAMFGPEAVRHAVPGSYPGYFRGVIERGLGAAGAERNYFLHHIFLGRYVERPGCLPPYLERAGDPASLPAPLFASPWYTAIHGRMDAVRDFGAYDVIGLSNIFDWTDRADVAALAARIKREARPGATVVFRQLNNPSDFAASFAPEFRFDAPWAARLHAADRSLFYSALHIGTREVLG
jgi:S-adenosylmethionine-diacylglycerol 3-amino-3-carboxypropyl transferase